MVDKSDTAPDSNWFLNLNQDAPSHEEEHDGHDVLPNDTLGVALSGGGIRSATFCLGILQSMAQKGWLKHVDYMSSVSGGGYIGSFLGRYFDVAQDPEEVDQGVADHQSPPVHWLRTHANYLSPSGTGDNAFNFATFWRNLFAVHFVLICFALMVFGLINTFTYWPQDFVPGFLKGSIQAVSSLVALLTPLSALLVEQTQFDSVWFRLAEITLWLSVIPLAISYWVVSSTRLQDFAPGGLIAAFLVSLTALFATQWVGALLVFAAIIYWVLYTWWSILVEEGNGDPKSEYRIILGRRYLTYFLAISSAITFILLVISAIDFAGMYFAHTLLSLDSDWYSFYGVLVSLATMLGTVPIFRGLANYVAAATTGNAGIVVRLLRTPFVATGIVFVAVVILPLSIVAFFSHFSFQLGYSWAQGVGGTTAALLVSVLLGHKNRSSFVNKSSQLPIYSARLARVFLGAVNPERHRHAHGQNVSHVIEGDDVEFNHYAPHEHGGPLHLVNVAVNQTIDIASKRSNRDRKSENMAIGPAGVNISRTYHALWSQSVASHQQSLDLSNSTKLKAIGQINDHHPLLSHDNNPVQVEGLNLREWIAISGAAISPGMGRSTRLSHSLLYTATNLRLGYWWDSGLSSQDRDELPGRRTTLETLRRAFFYLFTAQGLLISEAFAKFGGPWLQNWYLSDGGHFEITGAYELMRRRVPFIVAIDAGADKDYKGEVLALLARTARIDFGAEFEDYSTSMAQNMGVPSDIAEQIGTFDELMAGDEEKLNKCVSLFKVNYPDIGKSHNAWHGRDHSWVLYIRAAVIGDDIPSDVKNYKLENPDFPNQPTLDQHFDEQQWESHRKLGEHIGSKLFS